MSINLSVFMFLIVGHILGDWLFQRSVWAINKANNIKCLLTHSLVYGWFCGLTMYLATWSWSLATIVFIICFVTHVLLDNRKPVLWWIKNIKGDKEALIWLVFVIDQCFHILIMFGIAVYFV